MKILAWTTILFAAVPASLMAQSTKEDIKKLVSRGVPENVILNYIQFKGPAARLSPDDIVELKQAGATDKIIAALMEPSVPSKRASIPPPAQDLPALPDPTPVPDPSNLPSPTLVQPPIGLAPTAPYDFGLYDPTSGYPYVYYPQYFPRPTVLLAPYPVVVPSPRFHPYSPWPNVGHSYRGGSGRGSSNSGGHHR